MIILELMLMSFSLLLLSLCYIHLPLKAERNSQACLRFLSRWFSFYTTMEFRNRRRYEWLHERFKKNLLECFWRQQWNGRKHISVDVGLMTSDKDSQSPFFRFVLFELLRLFSHRNGYDIKEDMLSERKEEPIVGSLRLNRRSNWLNSRALLSQFVWTKL